MAYIIGQGLKEGEFFNKWLENRLIKNNKNVLSAELGPTGSGKSYRDLRKAELWYEYHFKEKFPTENICFGIPNIMNLLASGKLRQGDIIIGEEAGVNLGSRGWQSKMSQMFNYVLQSFRSMNIAIFFNLPYLSMLDSQARHLLHYYGESVGIDFNRGINKCKPFFLQVAQSSGKIYRHYPKARIAGRTKKIQRFNYALPSQYLIDAYEEKKQKYLKDLIKDYSDKTAPKIKVEIKKDYPTELQYECFHLWSKQGLSQREIGERIGKSKLTVHNYIQKVKKYNKLVQNRRVNLVKTH